MGLTQFGLFFQRICPLSIERNREQKAQNFWEGFYKIGGVFITQTNLT